MPTSRKREAEESIDDKLLAILQSKAKKVKHDKHAVKDQACKDLDGELRRLKVKSPDTRVQQLRQQARETRTADCDVLEPINERLRAKEILARKAQKDMASFGARGLKIDALREQNRALDVADESRLTKEIAQLERHAKADNERNMQHLQRALGSTLRDKVMSGIENALQPNDDDSR